MWVRLAFLFVLALPASAHALLVKALPAENTIVSASDVPFALTFNSRIDASRLTLLLPDNTTRVIAIQTQTPSETLQAQATDLKPGNYQLRWQVLAIDGHITRGVITFRVK